MSDSSANHCDYLHRHSSASDSRAAERRVSWVLWLTLVTMVAEIVAGTAFKSMALLADGWHMGTHVAAFLISLFAYSYARKHAQNSSFTFGTGKVSSLGGFASAVGLAVVAMMMALESIERLVHPENIEFKQAMVVAALGLVVNLISAALLHEEHDHDHNMKAAYFHVLADALTSVLAIAALCAGLFLHWNWLDATMGLVGAAIITRWSIGLIRESSDILLDRDLETETGKRVRDLVEQQHGDKVLDLHNWSLAPGKHALILSIETASTRSADQYKEDLRQNVPGLGHITVEILRSE